MVVLLPVAVVVEVPAVDARPVGGTVVVAVGGAVVIAGAI